MSKDEVRQRAATAREHLQVAQERHGYASMNPAPTANAQVAASNAILAGIAASDAICGRVLGLRAADQDHQSATKLLSSVQPNGPRLAKKLARLLANKSQLQYGGFCTTATAADMIRQAREIVDSLSADHSL